MTRRPLASFAKLWVRHERLYLEVFRLSLEKLSKKSLCGDENSISEILADITKDACFELGKGRNWEIKRPCWELPKQPIGEDGLAGGTKSKIPDFTCSCINPNTEKPEEYEIFFHVECKRLGKLDSGWPLNKNYVTEGIKRFLSKEHEYGKRAPSGMMLGYVINMTPSTIQDQVNNHICNQIPKVPSVNFKFADKALSQTTQELRRREVEPFNFLLHHLWVDLRENYRL